MTVRFVPGAPPQRDVKKLLLMMERPLEAASHHDLVYEEAVQTLLTEAGLLTCPEGGLASSEARVEDEADALATGPRLDVDPHADVSGPLHRGRGGEVDLLKDLEHPPLLLHLHIVHIEEERIVSDEVTANLDED